MGEQRQERLAVRLRVQRLPPVGTQVGDLVEVGGEVVEALRPHEEALRDFRRPRQPQRLGQR